MNSRLGQALFPVKVSFRPAASSPFTNPVFIILVQAGGRTCLQARLCSRWLEEVPIPVPLRGNEPQLCYRPTWSWASHFTLRSLPTFKIGMMMAFVRCPMWQEERVKNSNSRSCTILSVRLRGWGAGETGSLGSNFSPSHCAITCFPKIFFGK